MSQGKSTVTEVNLAPIGSSTSITTSISSAPNESNENNKASQNSWKLPTGTQTEKLQLEADTFQKKKFKAP